MLSFLNFKLYSFILSTSRNNFFIKSINFGNLAWDFHKKVSFRLSEVIEESWMNLFGKKQKQNFSFLFSIFWKICFSSGSESFKSFFIIYWNSYKFCASDASTIILFFSAVLKIISFSFKKIVFSSKTLHSITLS